MRTLSFPIQSFRSVLVEGTERAGRNLYCDSSKFYAWLERGCLETSGKASFQ
jgi:hypothetical protein